MQRILEAVAAPRDATALRPAFEHTWPAYRRWFLRDGERARATYLECERAFRTHMPELLPVWLGLVDAVGGGDLPARFLSMWKPRAYVTGCSQAAWTRGEPFLIRNYDYHPALWDGRLVRSSWLDRPVLAMTDCLWGVLDGINGDGLAVTLSFGGRRVVGDGFGMPVILRYVLETCATTDQAVRALARVPSHMAYNVTVLDAEGHARTVRVAPDRPAEVDERAVATNHQLRGEGSAYARATRSRERARVLGQALGSDSADAFADRFLRPPLFAADYGRGHGTLYTALYRPAARALTLRWPGLDRTWPIDAFHEARVPLGFGTLAAAGGAAS